MPKNKTEQEKEENQGFNVDLRKTPKAETENILSLIGLCVTGIDPVKTLIHPEMEYIIDLPTEIMKEIADGEAWFSRRKEGGEILAQIVHKVGNKTEIYKIPNVVEKVASKGEAVASLGMSLAMAAMSQKLDDISKDIEDVKKHVVHIEEELKIATFSKIYGAEKLIYEAIESSDVSIRRDKLINALQTLSEGSADLEANIKNKLQAFSRIPYKKIELMNRKFKPELRELNEEIHEYLDVYKLSQELRAYSNVVLNDTGALKVIFRQQDKFLESIDIEQLARAGYAYRIGTNKVQWLISPRKPFEDLKKRYLGFAERRGETISVKVTGEQLQLALAG